VTFREGKKGPPLQRTRSNERDGNYGDHWRQHSKKQREEKENGSREEEKNENKRK